MSSPDGSFWKREYESRRRSDGSHPDDPAALASKAAAPGVESLRGVENDLFDFPVALARPAAAVADADAALVASQLQAAYDKVKCWPEKNGEQGFMDLIELRNLVPASIDFLRRLAARPAPVGAVEVPAEDAKVRKIISEAVSRARKLKLYRINERQAQIDIIINDAVAALSAARQAGETGDTDAKDAARYRYLRDHCSYHAHMTWEQPAEWSIGWEFQQRTPAEASGSFDYLIDQDIERRAKIDAEDADPNPGSADTTGAGK